jgi:hypothetical protein
MTSINKTGSSTAYQLLKYGVYLALLVNVFLFLVEEIDSAGALNTAVTGFASFFQIFSTTIDTAAWLALLIFFELETFVLSDSTLRGSTGRLIHLVRLVCLATISVACWGYFAEFAGLLTTSAVTPANCASIDSSWSVLVNLDRFEPLATNPCESGQWLALSDYERVIATPESYQRAVLLAAVDFINAAAWILVVIVLEIEVRAVLSSSRKQLIGSAVINPTKGLLYLILFAAAVYWGFEDDFLDFWDAVLWLFAFFVIERNVVSWRQEAEVDQALPYKAL